MCGIAGFYNAGGQTDSRKEILRHMLTRIKHRGPDESGVYLNEQVGLGSVRLSIIDLSTGTMPLCNEDHSFWIVFNGEIFNYIELKEELEALGHRFETSSDTEVIVHLYEEFGPDFLHKLNGQFAIAIWDKNRSELFLARDRVGIRPLFYTTQGDTFIFASEIKALLEYPDLELKLSPKAIAQYFTFWTALTPTTAFEGVYELPPGSYMVVNEQGKTVRRFWELPTHKEDSCVYHNVEDAAIAFEKIFRDAVRLRLRADVPVAAYLSGGIDSSVTTSFIKSISPDNLRTFSIGFEEKDYDESSYQNLASEYFQTDHSAVTCSSRDIAQEFEVVVWHAEAPLLRTAPAPMSLLAKSVRDQNIKVVITGEGADELLGGYNIFKETKIRRFWAKDPNSKFRSLLLKKLYPYLPQMKNANNNVLKMFFGYRLGETEHPFYSHLLRWNNTGRIRNYLSQSFKEVCEGYDPMDDIQSHYQSKLEGLDSLAKAQRLEVDIFMSGYLLSSQGDRMAMAHSVEGRYPFLDYRVIEFCMSLDPDLKLNGLNEKYLLKKMMKNRIPDPILNRPKQAYRAPIKSVLAAEDGPEYFKEMLSGPVLEDFGIFHPNYVDQLLKKMRTKSVVSEIDNMALTAVLSTQILHDKFVKKNIPQLKTENLITLNKFIVEDAIVKS
ncbi:asparagine synthase (glutamine-hydrolyzing) [Muriicola marianensis]|uniref:asparagine synthase (glutamine-hydrolyzing) n=1 Tax=Muriicola marianensis TaxID=1324801 RepID=A0ABQ1QQQ4_9FLAO|nr:asparagine synthase (glutamine-hydrolyzing) [Muriicola marianensis]GGD41179.1 asparagine synthetase B [Muriicola marianensis]